MEPTKIIGKVKEYYVPRLVYGHAHEFDPCGLAEEDMEEDDRYATMVVHQKELEPVYTESEVVEMFLNLIDKTGSDAGSLCEWGLKKLSLKEAQEGAYKAATDLYERGRQEIAHQCGYDLINESWKDTRK